MSAYLQFIPILASAVAGIIGIFSKKQPSELGKLDIAVIFVILVSASASLYLIYAKILFDAQQSGYTRAIGVDFSQPFVSSGLFLTIDETAFNAGDFVATKVPLVQYLAKMRSDDGPVGHFDFYGLGGEPLTAELHQCNGTLIINEIGSKGKPSKYYAAAYTYAGDGKTPGCTNIHEDPKEIDVYPPERRWIFEEIAGATDHAIDIRNTDKAGKVTDRLEQNKGVAELTLFNSFSDNDFKSYIEKYISAEIKLRQAAVENNAIGEDCYGVYVLPLTLQMSKVNENDLSIKLYLEKQGKFIRCEYSPI